jgi:hypothetical protein
MKNYYPAWGYVIEWIGLVLLGWDLDVHIAGSTLMRHMGSLGRTREEVMELWIRMGVGSGIVMYGGIGGVMALRLG